MNLREIETLRTKEELVRYFEEMGQSITEEEIEALKKSYEEVQEKDGALTLEQLDEVAGGLSVYIERLAACRQPLSREAKFDVIYRNAFLLTKDGKTEITTPSGEKYIAMVESDNGTNGCDGYALKLFHEETNQWITLLSDDIRSQHSDLYEAIRTFIGDGEGLSLTPTDVAPVNEERREHEREEQLLHSGEWGPSVLVDSFVNGHNRFDEFVPYEIQVNLKGTELEHAEYVLEHIDQFSPEIIEVAARFKLDNIETGRSQENSDTAKSMPEHDSDSTMP